MKLTKDIKFIINRANEICELNSESHGGFFTYKRPNEPEYLKDITVNADGVFYHEQETKYDIIELLTPTTHPELYL